MPRCLDCSKALIPKEVPDKSMIRIRTWPSGPELIRLSETTGCELCTFVRKYPEKVSSTNLRHLQDEAAIVLQDCHTEIALSVGPNDEDGYISFIQIPSFQWSRALDMKPVAFHAAIPALKTPYNPVLHACELLEACVLGDKDEHHDCEPVKRGIPAKVEQLPRRLLDLSHGDHILTLDVQAWISTTRATVDQLSNYCTLTYRWGKGPPGCMLSTEFTGEKVSLFESLPQTFKDAIIVARALKIRFIWIDAMCIVQPSAHGNFNDWNTEGPRMWLVYENATCNIAATCSSNPDEGFLSRAGTDVSLPEENKRRERFEILDIEHVSSVSYRLSWDELQDPAMAKSVYHVVPLRMTGSDDAAAGYLVCLVVESLPSASDKDYGDSCKIFRRIGWFELGISWDVDEEDQWHEAPSDVLLAAMFPDITTQTIIVV
ncbi:unnamed protein product [Alternaria alternata]